MAADSSYTFIAIKHDSLNFASGTPTVAPATAFASPLTKAGYYTTGAIPQTSTYTKAHATAVTIDGTSPNTVTG